MESLMSRRAAAAILLAFLLGGCGLVILTQANTSVPAGSQPAEARDAGAREASQPAEARDAGARDARL